MPDQSEALSPSIDKVESPVLVYRGVAQEHDRERVGAWWTTNPYYALAYTKGSEGQMFVAAIDREALNQLAQDASIDQGYENYTFGNEDPPGARVVTQAEIAALRAATSVSNVAELGLPGGGDLIKWPSDAVEVGQSIFGMKGPGSIAVAQTAHLDSAEQ